MGELHAVGTGTDGGRGVAGNHVCRGLWRLAVDAPRRPCGAELTPPSLFFDSDLFGVFNASEETQSIAGQRRDHQAGTYPSGAACNDGSWLGRHAEAVGYHGTR